MINDNSMISFYRFFCNQFAILKRHRYFHVFTILITIIITFSLHDFISGTFKSITIHLSTQSDSMNSYKDIDMQLTDKLFWDKIYTSHGFNTENSFRSSIETCDGFFSSWPSDCVDKYQELADRLNIISAQMNIMNASFTLYVTSKKGCNFPYTNIAIESYNNTEILEYMGFGDEQFKKMELWKKTRYTRLSDIIRIGLAHKFQKSYLDTDVHFLFLNKQQYLQPYVGVGVYANNKNNLEITNAAFCLPRRILSDMISFQRNRIAKGSNNYFYTELGPSMFHHTLLNRFHILLYSQNNPAEGSINIISNDIHLYGHKQLHLTGNVRKANSKLSFSELCNKIRKQSGFPIIPLN